MNHRSLLFTPGTQKEKMVKSLQSEADALIWDLEDAVHPDEKHIAQANIHELLLEIGEKPKKPIYLRVNPYNSPWFYDDVKLAACDAVQGVLLPKTENANQVEEVWNMTNQQGEIITLIETALGLIHLKEILNQNSITGVALGAIDLAVDLDLTLTDSGEELIYARSKIVTLAKAFGIPGIYDTVFPDIHNLESLRHRAKLARQSGFNGQMAIHPKQIGIIHDVYSPSKSDIEWSMRVLDACGKEESGSGVFTIDGKMIDRPVIDRAKQIHTAAKRYSLV